MIFKKFEDLTFADHYMFEKVLQNAEICQELLERLLKIEIDHLEYPEIEKIIPPISTRTKQVCKMYNKCIKKTGVDEKEPNEALQAKRSTSEFGDFSSKACFFSGNNSILQNCEEYFFLDNFQIVQVS